MKPIAKGAAKIITIACAVGMFTCLLVDFLINRAITWSAYPTLAIPYGWLITMSLLNAKTHAIRNGFLAISVLTLPFLFLLDRALPGANWFFALGLPIGLSSIVSIWITYFVVRNVRNGWLMAGILVLEYGILLNGIIHIALTNFLNKPLFSLNLGINLASSLLIAVVCFVLALGKRREA